LGKEGNVTERTQLFDEEKLRNRLPIGWIGRSFHYHETIGSTNTEAVRLAEAGAAHGTLVLADSQEKGKGRGDRVWITLPGTALAFSLIIRPTTLKADQWLRLFGLGALSVTNGLNKIGLKAEIKWPNDVYLEGKKTAGILLTSNWNGEEIDYSVLGIGLNVTPESIPDDAGFDFPAVSIVEVLGSSIEREELLISILSNLEELYGRIATDEFIKEWQSKLAYYNQMVVVQKPQEKITGILRGLTLRGELKLADPSGIEMIVGYGDMNMRPSEL
jgi:BirA family biotin operon repressor/biotin-[acetyl-CoA-carboxylase] ligase